MKFGNLNFLETSGPLQTCNGTALPLFQIYWWQQLSVDQSGDDCLPQILGSSTSCQVAQQWLPNITTYFSLAYARMASKEQARSSATDRLVLPGRMQLPRIRIIPHGLRNASVSFWHSRLKLPAILAFSGCLSGQSDVRSLRKKTRVTQEGRSVWRFGRLSAFEFTKFPRRAILRRIYKIKYWNQTSCNTFTKWQNKIQSWNLLHNTETYAAGASGVAARAADTTGRQN